MTENVKYYSKPTVRDAWADTAIVGATGDLQDPDATSAYTPGNVTVPSVSKGWQQSTTPPPRQFFNFVLNWVMGAIRYFSQRGIVDWDPLENYQPGAVVQYEGFLYQAIAANSDEIPPLFSNWSSLYGYATQAYVNTYYAEITYVAEFFATINNGFFTGDPITVPTPSFGVSNAQAPNTNWVQQALLSYAKIAGAAFTGTVTVPTPAANDSSTKAANTAWVNEQLGSAVANEYEISPNGVYRQWGQAPFTGSSPQTISFPIAFPTACYNLQITPFSTAETVAVTALSRNGATVISSNGSGFYWSAIGD